MKDKLVFGDIYDKRHYNYMLEINGEDYYLKESDFRTTSDSRILESCVEDIDGGDTFSEYCEELFEMLEEEGYWD